MDLPPRASTVFERSMRELETVKVIHKPHCMAYFCDDGTIRDGDDADAKFVAKPRAHLSADGAVQTRLCSLAEPHPRRARASKPTIGFVPLECITSCKVHNRIAFRGVNCHYDRSVFPFPTQQLIEHNRQASETETFPLASRKHGKHIASLHKLSTTSSCSGLRS